MASAAVTAAARRLATARSLGPLRSSTCSCARVSSNAAWRSARRGFAGTSLRADKFYSEKHEWIDLSADGSEGTVGITVYAAKALGDVVFVELPAADLVVGVDDALGAVESVKSASDIYAPAAGTVVATNAVLEDKPGKINEDPEGDGWIARLKLDDGEAERARKSLMTAEKYAEHTEGAD